MWDRVVAFGKVVSTELRGTLKSIVANLSFLESADGKPNVSNAEPMFGAGPLFWRPKPPVKAADATGLSPEGHAEVIGLRVGDEVRPVAYRDLRLNAQANPKDGEVVIAQYGGGFISLKDNDDGDGTSITIYALRKTAGGEPDKAHVISLDTTAAGANISIVHETGQSISLNKAGDITLMSADGTAFLQVKNGEVVLSGSSLSLPGGAVVGASDPAGAQPVVLATDLLTFAAQTVTAIGQIAAKLNAAAAPVVSAPSTVTPVTAIPVASTKLSAAP